jgi:hypothetical protein
VVVVISATIVARIGHDADPGWTAPAWRADRPAHSCDRVLGE